MLTVLILVAVAAFVCTLFAGLRWPQYLWIAVLLLSIFALLQVVPLGR
jgi:hypothetical protein